MDNQEYVYKETAEEKVATPEYKSSKWDDLKKFISKNSNDNYSSSIYSIHNIIKRR